MTNLHSLIAFCAILVAIIYLATVAALLSYYGKYAEALGFGGLTTGLVGIAGTFRPRTDNLQQAELTSEAIAKIPPVVPEPTAAEKRAALVERTQ